MTNRLIIVIFTVLSIYLISCNEQPTELGYQIDSVSFQAVSSSEVNMILNSESQRYYLSGFNQGVIQVGMTEEYSAYPILRYENIAFLDSAEVISAELNLIKSGYALGDTNGLQSFEVFEVKVPVLPTDNYKTIVEDNGLDNIYEGVLMGQLENTFSQIEDTAKINLNLQLIQNWIDFSVLEATDAIDSNDFRRQHSYSIGLRPTANSEVISAYLTERVGASGDDAPNPFIQIVYKWPDSTSNDTLMLRANVAAFYATGPEPDANSLTVQSGVSVRSKLDFDVSALPEYASVVKAVLKVYVDDERSNVGSLGRDSFLLAQKDVTFEDGFFENVDNIYLGLRQSGNNYYRFTSVTSAVEDWVRGERKGSLLFNYAPNTNPSDSYFRLDKYYLYGADAEAALRPELTIFYAKRPEF